MPECGPVYLLTLGKQGNTKMLRFLQASNWGFFESKQGTHSGFDPDRPGEFPCWRPDQAD
jgi:hypothetical protein